MEKDKYDEASTYFKGDKDAKSSPSPIGSFSPTSTVDVIKMIPIQSFLQQRQFLLQTMLSVKRVL